MSDYNEQRRTAQERGAMSERVCEDCGESTVSEKLPRCLCEPRETEPNNPDEIDPQLVEMADTLLRVSSGEAARRLRTGDEQAMEDLQRAIGGAVFLLRRAAGADPCWWNNKEAS